MCLLEAGAPASRRLPWQQRLSNLKEFLMPAEPPQIASWLQPQEILLNVEVKDRFHALETMAAAIGKRHALDTAPIARALWRREQAGSTAIGDGFAIPHAQIEALTRPLTLFMRTASRIDFKAPDGKPVADFLAIMVPHFDSIYRHLGGTRDPYFIPPDHLNHFNRKSLGNLSEQFGF